jgi:hypothetical protein
MALVVSHNLDASETVRIGQVLTGPEYFHREIEMGGRKGRRYSLGQVSPFFTVLYFMGLWLKLNIPTAILNIWE